ncbi:MAG: cyclopropane-fatty-acyl-phospholipid synthase [Psychrobacter glaciei]|jgi:cyclopropane-fatty-acyl-phospholipid synthase
MSASVANIDIKKPRGLGLQKIAKKAVLSQLKKIHTGKIIIKDGDNILEFGSNQSSLLVGELEILDNSAYVDILTGGSIGAAEAYMTGDWITDDLAGLMKVMVRNMDVLDAMEGGLVNLISKPFLKWFHYLNQNSAKGSRRNIAAHYDLGNDLFEQFLDPTMMYSSGIFPTADATMEQASNYKLKTICDSLKLTDTDRVVEIGTGWGGFALYAAKHYGCHVTTTTISEEQFKWAQQAVIREGLEDKITLLKQDYRLLIDRNENKFDKLVSIEMIEAVGAKYFDIYFKTVSQLLKPNGLALIQSITIEDQRFEGALKNVDFIQRYIFPGSCIPSIQSILTATKKSTDLNLVNSNDFGQDYARTLNSWLKQFNKNEEAITALGYSEDFKRMWRFYLSYCEGGFAERAIGVSHLLLAKPEYKYESTIK